MEKKVKVLAFTILAIVLILAILQFFPQTRTDLTGRTAGLAIQSKVMAEQEGKAEISEPIDDFFANITDFLNSDEKYTDFIYKCKYHSVELMVGKTSYYFEYDASEGKVVQTEKKNTDFIIKMKPKKFNKIIELYEGGSYHEAAMYMMSELPGRVKVNIFKQCMATEWCKEFNF
jgi:hypothetical protein